MPQTSAGILLFRHAQAGAEVLLVHPGGPFWAKKDSGAWSIPKGLCAPGEEPDAAARREFEEETGQAITTPLIPLGAFRQSSAKIVIAFASEGAFEPQDLRSNTFELEWPPRSGLMIDVPEADRAGWFGAEAARMKMIKGQVPMLEALLARL